MMTRTAVRNPRYRNGHRRRALRNRVLREETHCALCNRPVDITLPHLDPWSATLDEIVPISRGGNPLDRDNVRLAHRRCNRLRGNGSRQRAVVAPFMTARRW
jgi:5-methylcytosine-specific restriction endonuclease McrA